MGRALVGSEAGSRIAVIFPAGMADIPGYLDPTEAYVLSIDVVSIGSPDGVEAG